MPKVLFAGGRLDSLIFTAGVVESTTSSYFDATYCDAAIQTPNASAIWKAILRDTSFAPYDVVDGETVYIHCDCYHATNNNVASQIWIEDSSGYPWMALRTVSGGVWGIYYNSGTGPSPVWTLVGSTFSVPAVTRFNLDIKFVKNSAGTHSVEFFINNTPTASGTFTQASLGFRSVRGAGYNASNAWSQIMVVEGRSTINGKVKYNRPSGVGASSAWTGAYTDVNEAVNNDSTVNSSATAGQRQTYAMQDITLPSASYSIQGIWQWVRAKNDGAAPSNIKLTIRIGGVDYDTASDISGVGVGFSASGARWDNDPSTSTAWTASNWNSAEAGFLSAT